MTTVDPFKGQFAGPEPLATLKSYRSVYASLSPTKSTFMATAPLHHVSYSQWKRGPILLPKSYSHRVRGHDKGNDFSVCTLRITTVCHAALSAD
jgi:hypothetical protein